MFPAAASYMEPHKLNQSGFSEPNFHPLLTTHKKEGEKKGEGEGEGKEEGIVF